MSIQFNVQAVQRAGLKGAYRAGRFFPSDGPVLVEVLDEQDEDPAAADLKAQPYRLGRKSWQTVVDDKRFRILPAGDTLKLEPAELQRQRQKFDASWAALKEMHAHELEQLKADAAAGAAHQEQIEKELVAALDQLGKLKDELAGKDTEIAALQALLEQDDAHENETPTETPAARKLAADKGHKGDKAEKHQRGG